ncbi:FlxA-like family protein [Paenibacillus pedocola]|uniref:FlxA-like family protein n=1 Tax=Paenibacillus pedocola TaxID=3242193 RepID=UPI002877B445|nr:FlxA-like family protein [Paenibacillus typhae]
MMSQALSGISPVQAIAAYGGTQSDVSSLEKQRDRLMMELDKVNAEQSDVVQTINRREQLQRQIRLLEAQLARKVGSSTSVDVVSASLQDQPPIWKTLGKGGFKGIGLADPRTATVDSEGHFNALI